MNQRLLVGALLCLFAGVAWGVQFPMASGMFAIIDPFYFTVLRYGTVSLILLLLLVLSEGFRALRPQGNGRRVWLYGTMAFTFYNFLVFFGQKRAGESGAMITSLVMALMPMASVLILWVRGGSAPRTFTLGCIVAAFVGVTLVISKGDIRLLSSTVGNLIPTLLIVTGMFGWVIYTIGGSAFIWSPLRYTALSCTLGTATGLMLVIVATMSGYLQRPTLGALGMIRWEMAYMIVISGVVAIFSWNAGNRALTPINGILFINVVPVTTFVITILAGYQMSHLEVLGAAVTITALVANNLYQRTALPASAAVRGDAVT